MVLNLGSMAIRGVFKGASLLGGLASTVTGLKGATRHGKSTRAEMKRMTGASNMLGKSLALIGVGGFTALMMSAPQLAGALAKIKLNVQLIAWAIGKHLKPLLDSVAKILTGIRTGDWSMILEGLKDAWASIKTLAWDTWVWLKETYTGIWDQLLGGDEAKPQWIKDIENWVLGLETIIVNKDWGAIWNHIKEPFVWMWENIKWGPIMNTIANAIASQTAALAKIGEAIFDGIWAGFMNKLYSIPGVGLDLLKAGPMKRGIAADMERYNSASWGGGEAGSKGFGGSWDSERKNVRSDNISVTINAPYLMGNVNDPSVKEQLAALFSISTGEKHNREMI